MEKKEKVDFVLRIAQKFVNADPETKQFVAGYLTRAEEEKKRAAKERNASCIGEVKKYGLCTEDFLKREVGRSKKILHKKKRRISDVK